MAVSRIVNTHFWRDTYIIDLDPTEKLLFMYLLTNPNTNLSGIYEISLRQAAFDTGIDRDMVLKIIDRFCADGKMFYQDGWIVLRNFMKHQRLNPSIKRGIAKSYADLPAWLREIVQIVENDNDSVDVIMPVTPQTGDRLVTASPHLIKSNLIKSNLIKSNLNKTNPSGLAEAAKGEQKISSKSIDGMFEYWQAEVGYAVTSKVKQNREACSKLLKEYDKGDIALMIRAAALASEDQYAPGVSNFIDLYRKWDALKLWGKKKGASSVRAEF